MSPNVSYCKNCTYKFDMDEFDRCPSCDHQGASTSKRGKVVSQNVDNANNIQVTTLADFGDLVTAQNRTTYAVRSLAIFLLTTFSTSVIGYGLVTAGANSAIRCGSYSECGADSMTMWGWVIIATGFFMGLGVGIRELGKSRP